MQQKESAARQALRKKRARKRAIRLAGAAALFRGHALPALRAFQHARAFFDSRGTTESHHVLPLACEAFGAARHANVQACMAAGRVIE